MKNIKKKFKKVFKLNKKTNKVKNESIIMNSNSTTRRVKSSETKTTEKAKPVKLFIKKEVSNKSEAESNNVIEEVSNDELKEEQIVEPTEKEAKEKNQLDKRERMELYKKCLLSKPAVGSINEAFDLINNTLVEIEQKYGPSADNKTFYYSKRYGRMFPLNREKLKFNAEIGKNEMITVGFTIYINKNGSFEFWSKNPKSPQLIFSKSGAYLQTNQSISLTQLII